MHIMQSEFFYSPIFQILNSLIILKNILKILQIIYIYIDVWLWSINHRDRVSSSSF